MQMGLGWRFLHFFLRNLFYLIASNRDILNGCLQVLHVYVLFVAPLGAGYMAQQGTDQHEGRVAIRETAHHAGAAADLPVQPLNDIVGADTGPVLAEKITTVYNKVRKSK